MRQICNCGAEIVNGAFCTNGHVQNRGIKEELGEAKYWRTIVTGLMWLGLIVLITFRALMGR
jgi:hypothetical protein